MVHAQGKRCRETMVAESAISSSRFPRRSKPNGRKSPTSGGFTDSASLRLLVFLTPVAFSFLGSLSSAVAHEGPDPVAHWVFEPSYQENDVFTARLGPDATMHGSGRLVGDGIESCLRLRGRARLDVGSISDTSASLPTRLLTISTMVAVDQPKEWGGIVGAFQDNGGEEQGWVLGYNKSNFYFGLSSDGADDGDGLLTYLQGKTTYEAGRLYHVVAVYDGTEMRLYVNGELDAKSTEQSGDILYPQKGQLTLGAYRDRNESFTHIGRLREISIFDQAATEKWVKHQFEHHEALVNLPADLNDISGDLKFEIEPYLQFVTRDSITVMWKSNRPANSTVRFGESIDLEREASNDSKTTIHEVRLDGLKPNTQYFYEASSATQSGYLHSQTLTFQTACDEQTPFAFAIISDTQDNPPVAKKISDLAWEQRPSFLIHPGDLVGIGTKASDWTAEFFPSMQPLISRVCMFPVLGNHEQDARFYYDYMSLPDPEYHYSFRYGNAEFFMIDSNRKIGPGSKQYQWLESKLAASNATWKFVCHHHPPYSSDENDYGDLWTTNKSTRGDLRVREMCRLYDKYGVDIVWNGHIHSYERTWPMKADRPVQFGDGTIYMITGGGGGGLETPGPYRPAFQNNVRRGHHFCMAHVNGGQLELKAFDLEGRLFDLLRCRK